jgi:hypothetical protein
MQARLRYACRNVRRKFHRLRSLRHEKDKFIDFPLIGLLFWRLRAAGGLVRVRRFHPRGDARKFAILDFSAESFLHDVLHDDFVDEHVEGDDQEEYEHVEKHLVPPLSNFL